MGYIVNKVRTLFWTLFYYLMSRFIFDALGRGCRFEGWIDIPQRGGKIVIGSNNRICRLVEFSVPKNGNLIIGNSNSIGRGVLISAHKSVVVGDDVMIAEYVCIHDNNHRFENVKIPISEQGFDAVPIFIGTGSWIGAHSLILCGGGLGGNSVLGAGSLLNKVMPDGVVVAGAPAKVTRYRLPIKSTEGINF